MAGQLLFLVRIPHWSVGAGGEEATRAAQAIKQAACPDPNSVPNAVTVSTIRAWAGGPLQAGTAQCRHAPHPPAPAMPPVSCSCMCPGLASALIICRGAGQPGKPGGAALLLPGLCGCPGGRGRARCEGRKGTNGRQHCSGRRGRPQQCWHTLLAGAGCLTVAAGVPLLPRSLRHRGGERRRGRARGG